MKQKYSLLLGLIISLQLTAQSNFKKGRIITLSGDTIVGEIEYLDNYKLSQKCYFRTAKSKKIQRFTPDDINGFLFDDKGRKFEKARLHYYGDSITAFVENLIIGKMSLYSLLLTSHNQTFYLKQKDKPNYVILPFERSERLVDNGYTKRFKIISSVHHIDSLKKYMADIPMLWRDIEKIEIPTENSLRNIVVKYNLLAAGNVGVMENETPVNNEVSKFFFEPVLGVSDFKDAYFNHNVLNAGCRIVVQINSQNERLLFSSGIFMRIQGKRVNVIETNDDIYSDVKVPLLIEYRFPKNIIQPRFSAGTTLFFTRDYMVIIPALNAGINYNITDKFAVSLMIGSEFHSLNINNNVRPKQNDFGGLVGLQFAL